MMFSLSRAGYAPARFGRVSRRGVPMSALLVSTLGIALATVLSIVYPDASFTLMMAVSMFGALFTWMMIFVTHYCFRRKWEAQGHGPLRFRMKGFPVLTLLGAALMLAIMVTTMFTAEFRMTMLFGVPWLALLSVAYFGWYARATRAEPLEPHAG
ncbi:Amino acid permease-associated protein (fragment) [Cupriavidus neocaledonicus]